MAKRKTQIDKAIAELDDKLAAVKIDRDQSIYLFEHKLDVLKECRDVLVATKAAHATVKTAKAAKAEHAAFKATKAS